jgi:predicted enzyme related to lactoylglutathione lyase
MPDDNPLFRHGKLSYMQIPATDVMASSAFYEAVFGWTLRGDEQHRSFDDASGELIGAWNPDLGISREPGILPYIYVEGVDATLAKVKENGGEVVRDPYPEGDLWVATFRDPAGNVLGVWQSGGP